MAKSNWDASHIPAQKGKVIIITGATSGLGKEAARVLASKEATVIMAIRNMDKGQEVMDGIKAKFPSAIIRLMKLDLASLASVEAFAHQFLGIYDRLDVLINNAGVMMCPYAQTKDGLEIQMGVNHFGHFALVGYLMPILKKTKAARVVVTASGAHHFGDINFSDINWESRKYKTSQAYSDSKLANILFMKAFVERYASDQDAPMITAAHPGWTETELQRHSGAAKFLNNIFAQKVEIGTLPTLRAAVDPTAQSGDYYGPSRFFEMRGYPVKVPTNKKADNTDTARQLWAASVKLTGVNY